MAIAFGNDIPLAQCTTLRMDTAGQIQNAVRERFGVKLEMEPEILGSQHYREVS